MISQLDDNNNTECLHLYKNDYCNKLIRNDENTETKLTEYLPR